MIAYQSRENKNPPTKVGKKEKLLISSQETLLVEYLGETDTEYEVRGVGIAPVENRGGGIGISVVPPGGVFGITTKSGIFRIAKSAIILSADLDNQLESLFIQATTGIQLTNTKL